ncbi:MAG: T9SS type A sorting domain-containing protein [bacterium]|nr:T9SS type A sorting domain-containing protein [bacterium]
MQKKLLFLSVFSFVVAFSAVAQDAPLKKVFNSSAPTLGSANTAKVSAIKGKLFEATAPINQIYIYDTTSVQVPVDSVLIANPGDDLTFYDLITVDDQLVFSVDFEGDNYLLSYDYVTGGFKNQGLGPLQIGINSRFTHLNRISEEAFIAFDSLNNRVIRFDPDTTGMNNSGFYASKNIFLNRILLPGDVGGIGARRDFEVYYVWDKSDNAIKRFDPNGDEGTKFDFDTQNIASGRELTIEAMVVEDNGRIVVAVNDQPNGAAKSLTPSTKRLIFFGGGFQFLGEVELPIGGSRGDFSTITDLDVDYDGNIYITHAADRSIRMLDDFNSPPFNNNSNQFSQVVLNQPTGYYPVTKDMIAFQDWNIEDTVVAIRLYPNLGINNSFILYYDANNDGIYDANTEEISTDNTDSLDVSISEIISGRLVIEANANLYTFGSVSNIFTYKWGDGTGFNPDKKGNILATILGNSVVINGVSGVDGWRLLASTRKNLTYEEFLDPLWTQGAVGSDLPLGSPNVFTYNTQDEDWSPVTDFSQIMQIGRGIAVYVYEDDDLNEPGVQGGWPKQIDLITEKSGIPNNENFELELIYTTNKAQPEYQGFNLLGNPYTTPYNLRNPFFVADSTSQILTYWEASYNNGAGRYLYLPLSPTNNQNLNLYLISQGQGFWLQGSSANASLTFYSAGTVGGSIPIPKKMQQPDPLSLYLNDDGFGDQLDVYFSELSAQKLFSLSDTYHEVFAIGDNEKPMAIIYGDFGKELVVPIGIRSTKSDKATLSINLADLSNHISSVHIEEHLPSGEVVSHNLIESPVTLSLKHDGETWKHQGNLFLILNNAQNVSSEVENSMPIDFKIGAYPNPFNPVTNIQYRLPNASNVQIEVFNTLGQRIMELNDLEFKQAGTHTLRLDLSKQNSGVYFVRITANNQVRTQSITLIK